MAGKQRWRPGHSLRLADGRAGERACLGADARAGAPEPVPPTPASLPGLQPPGSLKSTLQLWRPEQRPWGPQRFPLAEHLRNTVSEAGKLRPRQRTPLSPGCRADPAGTSLCTTNPPVGATHTSHPQASTQRQSQAHQGASHGHGWPAVHAGSRVCSLTCAETL